MWLIFHGEFYLLPLTTCERARAEDGRRGRRRSRKKLSRKISCTEWNVLCVCVRVSERPRVSEWGNINRFVKRPTIKLGEMQRNFATNSKRSVSAWKQQIIIFTVRRTRKRAINKRKASSSSTVTATTATAAATGVFRVLLFAFPDINNFINLRPKTQQIAESKLIAFEQVLNGCESMPGIFPLCAQEVNETNWWRKRRQGVWSATERHWQIHGAHITKKRSSNESDRERGRGKKRLEI